MTITVIFKNINNDFFISSYLMRGIESITVDLFIFNNQNILFIDNSSMTIDNDSFVYAKAMSLVT